MKSLAIALVLLAFPAAALAHGGRLDALGCHREAGEYHCHKGNLAGRSFASKDEALLALKETLRAPPAKWEPGEPITGKPSVISGDTIEITGHRLRLYGIDAPGTKQTCTIEGREWACGLEAASMLVTAIGDHRVTCDEKDAGRHRQVVAICHLDDGTDLGAWMVSRGWALADRRDTKDYVDEEEAAEASRKGIWRAKFTPPWEWFYGTRQGESEE